ncbi:MAG: PilZ domain-containing protein [Nitrospirota bacterium]|nr:PilZ domain-containing protein [Nitrospirota bacterium]
MPDKKNEERGHKRYIVDGIQGNVLYPADLEVLNLSIDGAAIETTKWLDLNREYTLKIKYKDVVLTLRGRVVWAILTSKKKRGSDKVIPVYRAGVRFTDTLSEKTTMLINFIEENKIRTLEKRLVGVRFKIANTQNVQIDYPYKYEVKKMSLSGMLVETEYVLDINSNYDIELFLNENVLNILGRVAYCEKIDSNDVTKYNIGMGFVEMSDNDREILKEFLNTLEDSNSR